MEEQANIVSVPIVEFRGFDLELSELHYQQFIQEYGSGNQLYSVEGSVSKIPSPEIGKKEFNVMPKKMNKLKEWSISARALKSVIYYILSHRRSRYDYKFNSVYDGKYNLYRIWNIATKNVVCTIRINVSHNGVTQAFIRYREASHYAPVFSSLNLQKIEIHIIPSKNLGLHRGSETVGIGRASASKEAQLGFRRRKAGL